MTERVKLMDSLNKKYEFVYNISSRENETKELRNKIINYITNQNKIRQYQEFRELLNRAKNLTYVHECLLISLCESSDDSSYDEFPNDILFVHIPVL